MYTTWDIYCKFRKAQAQYHNRGYRLPRDWSDYQKNKMGKTDLESLQTLTDYFNTKWNNIDVDMYMESGFDVLKSFNYKYFLDKRVIKKYITKDKAIKYKSHDIKQLLIKDAMYVKENWTDNIQLYINQVTPNNRRLVIHDYIKNNITAQFIVFLIRCGWLSLTDDEKALCPQITEQYRNIMGELDNIKNFTYKLRGKI